MQSVCKQLYTRPKIGARVQSRLCSSHAQADHSDELTDGFLNRHAYSSIVSTHYDGFFDHTKKIDIAFGSEHTQNFSVSQSNKWDGRTPCDWLRGPGIFRGAAMDCRQTFMIDQLEKARY